MELSSKEEKILTDLVTILSTVCLSKGRFFIDKEDFIQYELYESQQQACLGPVPEEGSTSLDTVLARSFLRAGFILLRDNVITQEEVSAFSAVIEFPDGEKTRAIVHYDTLDDEKTYFIELDGDGPSIRFSHQNLSPRTIMSMMYSQNNIEMLH